MLSKALSGLNETRIMTDSEVLELNDNIDKLSNISDKFLLASGPIRCFVWLE